MRVSLPSTFSLRGLLFSLVLVCSLLTAVLCRSQSPMVLTVGVYENPPKIFTPQGKPAGVFVNLSYWLE